VQVERTTTHHLLPPADVRIPGIFVDAVVVAGDGASQMQTFSEHYNPAYVGKVYAAVDRTATGGLDARKVIARRAATLLKQGSVVNIGIGIPEGVVAVAREEGILDQIELTVEAGPIGGIPAGGLSFGAAANAQAVIDMPYQFDFYDGVALDQAFLGMAQLDRHGNVNVSRFAGRLAGAGGFINISQAARSVLFLGTFNAGGEIEVGGGQIRIVREGSVAKLVEEVEHVTFSGQRAGASGRDVLYITERCVLRLTDTGLELVEIAPGLDLERDVLAMMPFRAAIASDLHEMDPALFIDAPLGLRDRSPVALEQCLAYRESDNLAVVDLAGLSVKTPRDAEQIAGFLRMRLRELGGHVDVITSFDEFELDQAMAVTFMDMLRANEQRYSAHAMRYCADPFLRHRLGGLVENVFGQRIHRSFHQAAAALGRA
jgi:propionate CoA-transferase